MSSLLKFMLFFTRKKVAANEIELSKSIVDFFLLLMLPSSYTGYQKVPLISAEMKFSHSTLKYFFSFRGNEICDSQDLSSSSKDTMRAIQKSIFHVKFADICRKKMKLFCLPFIAHSPRLLSQTVFCIESSLVKEKIMRKFRRKQEENFILTTDFLLFQFVFHFSIIFICWKFFASFPSTTSNKSDNVMWTNWKTLNPVKYLFLFLSLCNLHSATELRIIASIKNVFDRKVYFVKKKVSTFEFILK